MNEENSFETHDNLHTYTETDSELKLRSPGWKHTYKV